MCFPEALGIDVFLKELRVIQRNLTWDQWRTCKGQRRDAGCDTSENSKCATKERERHYQVLRSTGKKVTAGFTA